MADPTSSAAITDRRALRELYGEPSPTAVAVSKTYLDEYHQLFIRHSPFLCLASTAADGQPNVSPKGDGPGFVHIRDEKTLVIPDRLGNNKIETFENIMENPRVALIFFIPGVREMVRVQGTATLVRDPEVLELGRVGDKLPAASLVVHVTKSYLHCGKALVRSHLWDPSSQVADTTIPPFGQMIKDQADIDTPAEEIQESIEHEYRNELY